jgi:hypothetical protein
MIEKPPQDVRDILDELADGQFASIAELNSYLAVQTSSYNSRPQAELGGLSPDQTAQLLYGDWRGNGALRLNTELSASELAGAIILADARTLIRYVDERAPMKETQKRNLTRAAVKDLLPQLLIWSADRDRYRGTMPAPLNEGDVYFLQELRFVLVQAGLLVRRRGLRATKRGRQLITEERAGELYALLFETFFSCLDLRVLDRGDRHPGLQHTIAFTFFRLQSKAHDWACSQELADSAWLASAKDPPTENDVLYGDLRHYSLMHRVLTPLVHFGLLETRALPTDRDWLSRHEFRVTPLFDRFLGFQFN